jgi:hypothetical protein
MPARLPDFLGLGTQKGGTTSLHQWLNTHPQVFLPTCKEVHYFDLQAKQAATWYAKHFQDARPEQLCGEITPFYLFHPDVPARIHAVVPEVRMIVLLRDPVERALSQVFHARKRGFEKLKLEEALEAESSRLQSGDPESLQKHSYVNRSRYLDQLNRYETLFPREQLLVLQSEQLFADPESIWNEILNFLRLEITTLPKRMPRANAGNNESLRVSPSMRIKLRKELAATALGVRERYGFGWDWA